MASVKYSYSISTDFPNQKVATDRLTLEIQESEIVTALDYINTNGDDCDIWFKASLSSGDSNILDDIVDTHNGEPLPQPIQDINIKNSDVTLSSKIKGFHDLSGHNVYRFGNLLYDIKAGEHNVFYEKFSVGMWLEGGGVRIPEYLYVDGIKVEYKSEKGDYISLDIVDIDNVLGYGKTANISKISRSNNIVTVETTEPHSFTVDDVVCIDVSDSTFSDMEEKITSIGSTYSSSSSSSSLTDEIYNTFTYSQVGTDVDEKDVTGDVGLIILLGQFVPRDYVSSGESWECVKGDAKYIPSGIYLRFRYVSVGDTDVVAMPFYSLRT